MVFLHTSTRTKHGWSHRCVKTSVCVPIKYELLLRGPLPQKLLNLIKKSYKKSSSKGRKMLALTLPSIQRNPSIYSCSTKSHWMLARARFPVKKSKDSSGTSIWRLNASVILCRTTTSAYYQKRKQVKPCNNHFLRVRAVCEKYCLVI